MFVPLVLIMREKVKEGRRDRICLMEETTRLVLLHHITFLLHAVTAIHKTNEESQAGHKHAVRVLSG